MKFVIQREVYLYNNLVSLGTCIYLPPSHVVTDTKILKNNEMKVIQKPKKKKQKKNVNSYAPKIKNLFIFFNLTIVSIYVFTSVGTYLYIKN